MEIKLCPKCKESKSVTEFNFNAGRPDGYAYACKACRKLDLSDYTKRVLDPIFKNCSNCKRTMPRQMFVYSQNTDDCLTDTCRSCKLYRPRGFPSLEQVEYYEYQLRELVRTARQHFNPETERVLFEEFVYKQYHLRGIGHTWKTPLWLNDKLFKDG